MFTKMLAVLILVTATGSTVFGQDSLGTSTASLSNNTPSNTNVRFVSDTDLTFGTFVLTGGLSDGNRLNFTQWTPSYTALFSSGSSLSLDIPFIWTQDQSNNDERTIGRPAIVGQLPLFSDNDAQVFAGLALRLPMYDTSVGDAELFQIWGVEPGVSFDDRISDSTYHIIGGTSLDYESQAQTTAPSAFDPTQSVTQFYNRALTVRANVGAALERDNYTLAATYHIVDGLGNSDITDSFSSTNAQVAPVDTSSIMISGKLKVAEGTRISGNIIKGLKNIDGSSFVSGSLASFDRPAEISDLAVGFGLSQTF